MARVRLPGAVLGAVAVVLVSTVQFDADAIAQPTDFRLIRLDGSYVKWGGPILGTGATVSYSFADSRLHSPEARNCGELIPIDGLLSSSGISWEVLREEVDRAFAMWEEASDITFSYTPDAPSADIVIGAQGRPRGKAFTNVAFERDRDAPVASLTQSLICLNPTLPWKVGFGGDRDIFDLRYTFAHEIGHAIGLNHPGPEGQLMSFRYIEKFRNLQDGDQSGAVALYGARREAAKNVRAFPALGAMANPSPNRVRFSRGRPAR